MAAKKPPVSQFAGLKDLRDRKPRLEITGEEFSPEFAQHIKDKRTSGHDVPPKEAQQLQLPPDYGTDSSLLKLGKREPRQEPKREPKPIGRPRGKRSNPEFEQTTLFLRKDTKKAVTRQLEDHGAGDLSSLVERLLASWLKRQ